MSKYVVAIECVDKFIYETEAYDKHDAIVKAFENSYAWQRDYDSNKVVVKVNESDEEV